jgi:uncharacterized membrane protein YbhN (UPF0104 family)
MSAPTTTAPSPPAAPTSAVDAGAAVVRHQGDLARFVFGLALVAAGLFALLLDKSAALGISLDLLELIDWIPEPVDRAIVGTIQFLAIVAPIVLLARLLYERQYRAIGVTALAAVIAGFGMAVLNTMVDTKVPAEVADRANDVSFVTGAAFPSSSYLAAAIGVVVAVAPWSTRKWQRTGWVLVALVVFCRIATATEVPLVLLPALGVGIAAGSLALLALGAPPRRPHPNTVEAAIRRGGLDAGGVAPDGVIARNSQPYTATAANGVPLFVKVVGRDERDAAVLARIWRAIRVKGIEDERAPGSPHHSLERQALVAMLAADAGVRAPRPLLVDTIDESSALAVFEAVDATRLADVDPKTVTDRMLRDVWTQAARLQGRRIAHRWLNTGNVLIDADGQAWIIGYSYADQASDPASLTIDTAELLTSLALLVGARRTVKSAVAVLGRERVAAALPLLQPLALTSETRRAISRDKEFIKALQREVQTATRTPEFKAAQIERIGWRTVFMVIATAAVIYILLVQFTNAGDIAGALANMNLWYLVPILGFAAFTFVAAALSLVGAVTRALPLLLTTVVQFAQTFLNRFTPYNAGGMTLRVRYLQKRGTDLTSGAAAVGLTSAASGVMQVVLFVLFYLAAGAQTQDTRIELPDTSTIAALILVILLAAGGLLLIPWVRRRVLPPVFSILSKAFSTIGELSRNPVKMVLLFGGAALAKLAYIAAFAATCRAFGVDLPFATIGAVYLTATTIGSAVPTPGGLGGVEAALVGCLTAVGVDSDDAVAIMLVFRLATFWLPVLPGYLCFWWLERKEIV